MDPAKILIAEHQLTDRQNEIRTARMSDSLVVAPVTRSMYPIKRSYSVLSCMSDEGERREQKPTSSCCSSGGAAGV